LSFFFLAGISPTPVPPLAFNIDITAHQEKNFEQERTHYHLVSSQQTERIERLRTESDRLAAELERIKVEHVDPHPTETSQTNEDPASDSPLSIENKRLLFETQRTLELLDRTQIDLTTTSQTLHHVESDLLKTRSELDEQISINERLREENEVWEGLVGTRTLEGGIGLGIGIGMGMGGGTTTGQTTGQGVSSISGRSSTWKASRREKGKSLADELGGFDLVAFGKGLEDGSGDKVDEGETERVREENEGEC
jgi:hypothetical protein